MSDDPMLIVMQSIEALARSQATQRDSTRMLKDLLKQEGEAMSLILDRAEDLYRAREAHLFMIERLQERVQALEEAD
jgi:hypothetical protein